MKPVLAITAGDVAGIGPEVIVRALSRTDSSEIGRPLLIGHPEIFQQAAQLVGVTLPIRLVPEATLSSGTLREFLEACGRQQQVCCINPADDSVLIAPKRAVSAAAGDAAFRYLIKAIEMARNGDVDAIVTAPLNKESLHLGGHEFPGHTEILADRCGVAEFAMMLHLPESALTPWRQLIRPFGFDDGFDDGQSALPHGRNETSFSRKTLRPQSGISIAHVTLHTSIRSVPELLSREVVMEKIRLMSAFLGQIQCQRSAIAVCALNPHGGENGLFGSEEQTLITPAIQQCRSEGIDVTGPLPVDTLVRRAVSGEFDGVVAMYHDQGHIPIKLIGFDSAINITLGLPIVRTSPTHGTAFDRAWNAATPADSHGMLEAIRMAAKLSQAVGRT